MLKNMAENIITTGIFFPFVYKHKGNIIAMCKEGKLHKDTAISSIKLNQLSVFITKYRKTSNAGSSMINQPNLLFIMGPQFLPVCLP